MRLLHVRDRVVGSHAWMVFFSRIRTKKIAKVSIEKSLKLYDFEI